MRKSIILLLFLLCFLHVEKLVLGASEITPLPGQVNPYKTRSELLMDATRYIGVFTPEEAVSIWAKGLEKRSAAMQYVVMTDKLKKEYAEQLDAQQSNWVTGMSSPSVVNYSIVKPINIIDDTHAEVTITFEITAAGLLYSKFRNARLWLVIENGFWRIERISTDRELYPDTLYIP